MKKVVVPKICKLCDVTLTPETTTGTYDANQVLSYVCRDKGKCQERANEKRSEEWRKAKQPQITANEELQKTYGHLPQEEQLKAMFNLNMTDFARTELTRGGVTNHYLPDGTLYIWDLFSKKWQKAII